ncbi:MAG: citramalate synthase [Desulfobacterales bacterium]|nr:citramalate synthase [Desulfobacterales bacterium]MCP4158438.1 citramalate synthase [Deltaproteobacteria bacterium]
MEQVYILDTTLRDGAQGENISFTPEDKVKIAKKLDKLGIHYIEGGWPGSNPGADKFFELAKDIEFKNSKLTAFCSTRRPNIKADKDELLIALIKSGAPAITIFGKTWDLHVEDVMENTLEENLAMINDTVSFFKSNNREVLYDGEHFFDGYKNNREYALKTLAAALEGGAGFLVLCDTNGGTLPNEIEDIVLDVKQHLTEKYKDNDELLPVKIGIHAHNDCAMAVANTIAAVNKGAVMVQGTINGYGERCGNADLTSCIPVLCLKMNNWCIPEENLTYLHKVSRFISEIANMIPLNSRPFVGKSAFAHKGGIHVSAVMKIPKAYEHIEPEEVGNYRRILVSDQAGKSNIEYKAKEFGIDLNANGMDSKKIVAEIKRLENMGFQYDVADASFRILMEKMTKKFDPCFDFKSFRIAYEKDGNNACHSFATVKIEVNDIEEITAAEGHGPVNALDNALRKALKKFYKDELEAIHLVDYKVRILDGRDGTAAKVRVLIEFRDEDHIWTTVGFSEDIIEASWQALTDSFQYKLSK